MPRPRVSATPASTIGTSSGHRCANLGLFANYRYREWLFPTLIFRRAYAALRTTQGGRVDVEYVRVLHLAASTLEAYR